MPMSTVIDGVLREMTDDEIRAHDERIKQNIAYWRGVGDRATPLSIFRRHGRCIDCTRYYVSNGEYCDASGDRIRDAYQELDCFEPGEEEAE